MGRALLLGAVRPHRHPVAQRGPDRAAPQKQPRPQIVPTSNTQVESHPTRQQKVSVLQILATQLGVIGGSSQPGESGPPSKHIWCGQVPVLAGQMTELHMDRTSETQRASQPRLQQYGSWRQIWSVQGSHSRSSGTPVVHLSWAHEEGAQLPPIRSVPSDLRNPPERVTMTKNRNRSAPVRVLVVDDDAEMRALLVEELGREGWDVMDAADGGQAVQACRATTFDVILMDKNMPGPSGLDLLPGFRRACPESHIIMMTAFGDVPSFVEATEKGAVDFLFKPFRVDDMRTAIRKALGLESVPPA